MAKLVVGYVEDNHKVSDPPTFFYDSFNFIFYFSSRFSFSSIFPQIFHEPIIALQVLTIGMTRFGCSWDKVQKCSQILHIYTTLLLNFFSVPRYP